MRIAGIALGLAVVAIGVKWTGAGAIRRALSQVGVNIVWSPPWNPDMMSEDAKMELGFF